jgi:apolipoprotein N-acyltransferase
MFDEIRSARPLPRWLGGAGIVASALLLGLFARGGLAWPLGFVALVPWLLTLGATRSLAGALASGWLMSIALVAAVFPWFGTAIGSYTGSGTLPATLVLLALAPLLQPQVIVFALVRHWAGRGHGVVLRALAGPAAWVGCEWLLPKLLGDTLGHGLAPAATLRQVADLGGAALISLLLLLANEAVALGMRRWRDGWRRWLPPLALATAVPALMAGYGVWRLNVLEAQLAEPAPALRIALVQSGIVDYERRRRESGTYAVVRHVLDTHFALTRAAIEHHGAEAVLWSETVYPTPFGHPRSEDGAALDREILDFVDASGVPLVFGTYDVDDAGEYNAAAFVEPGVGLLGYYRKTHPFPLTEYVPDWLDGPLLRRWLPWTGNWRPGNGARVFPLRSTDGRELNVLPLICLDDVRPGLAIDGARLGAQAIVGLSNDSWFSSDPIGAQLHLAVASFRSIETRLPQLRVTTNGLSAFVDPTGEVLVSTTMGDQSVLAGEVPLRDPPPTLMLRWGDWVGGAALAWLLALAIASARRAWLVRSRRISAAAANSVVDPADFGADVALLTPAWRIAAAMLRIAAAGGLLWLALGVLLRDGLQVNSLLQIRIHVWMVLLPLAAAWAIGRLHAARLRIEGGQLLLQQRRQRIEIPLASIARLRTWRLPLPAAGIDLHLQSGRRYPHGLRIADPPALMRALKAAGSPVAWSDPASAGRADFAAARAAARRLRLDHPLVKFVLFPLLPAIPAFRLHQYIAFGGSFGEYYTYGLQAYAAGFMIWWAAWSIGLMLYASALRILGEASMLAASRRRPPRADVVRQQVEWLCRWAFYLGVPAWLLLRLLAS